MSDGTRVVRGSCHCGRVRFEADVDLGRGTTRCNCTRCTKTGWWGLMLKPSAFRLLAGDEAIERSGTRTAEYGRCLGCGIVPFGHGDVPAIGGEYYSINVRCLDDLDLDGILVRYLDGRSDTWAELRAAPYRDPFVG